MEIVSLSLGVIANIGLQNLSNFIREEEKEVSFLSDGKNGGSYCFLAGIYC